MCIYGLKTKKTNKQKGWLCLRFFACLIVSLCYLCLFMWITQSLNIWTHLLAFFLFSYLIVYELCIRSEHIRVCVLVTCIACVITFIGSILYHSGMSKCHCQEEYSQCMKYDVMGVIISMTLTMASPMFHGYRCNNTIFVVISTVILLCTVLYSSANALADGATPKIRGKYIGIYALVRMFLATACILGNVIWHNQLMAIKWYCTATALLIIGGSINVSHFPENLFPARMDFIGNSHQIWHVFVVLSCLCGYYGCVWDDIYWHQTICSAESPHDVDSARLQQPFSNFTIHTASIDFIVDPSFLYYPF